MDDSGQQMDVDQGGRGGTQEFCLKWNSFGSNLAEAFSILYRSGSMTDCTIFCAEQQFAVHRIVLAACSSFFMSVLEKTFPNSPHATVIILNVKPDNMKALLEFMYSGQVNVSQDALKELLKDAENLQIKGLSVMDPDKVDKMRPDEIANTMVRESRIQFSSRNHSSIMSHEVSGNSLHNNNNSHEDDHNNDDHHHSSRHHHHHHHGGSGIHCSSSGGVNSGAPIILNGHASSSSSTPSHTPHNSSSSPGADAQPPTVAADSSRDLENGGPILKLRHGSESPNHNNSTSSPAIPSSITGYTSFLNNHAMFYDSPQKRLMSVINACANESRKNGIKNELQDMSNRSAMLNDANYRSNASPHPSTHAMSMESRYGHYVGNHLSPLAASPNHHQRHSPNHPDINDHHHDRDRSAERGDGNDEDDLAEDLRIKHEPKIKSELDVRNLERTLESRLSGDLYGMNGRGAGGASSLYDGPAFPHNGESVHQQAVRAASLIMSGGGNIALDAAAGRPCSPSGWNAKINKAGTVSTPEGRLKSDALFTSSAIAAAVAEAEEASAISGERKKLKCPFCERLYGYETNLRAHVRQRHQGIRVPCPHCDRTFTRRNTVRRHIAREHKHHAPAGQPLPSPDKDPNSRQGGNGGNSRGGGSKAQ